MDVGLQELVIYYGNDKKETLKVSNYFDLKNRINMVNNKLNDLGNDGWELVGLTQEARISNFATSIYFFKKPIINNE